MPCRRCTCEDCIKYKEKCAKDMKNRDAETKASKKYYIKNREERLLKRRQRYESQQRALGRPPKKYTPRSEPYKSKEDRCKEFLE